jgi:hypothetical protein
VRRSLLTRVRAAHFGKESGVRKGLALMALAIAGFAFGFTGCGEDDESPGGDVTVTATDDTTTDDTMTETNGTTGEDDGGGGNGY